MTSQKPVEEGKFFPLTIKTEILKPITNILNNVATEKAYLIGNDGIHFQMNKSVLNISADSRELNVLFSNVRHEPPEIIMADFEFLVNSDKLNHIVANTTSKSIQLIPQGENPSGGQGKIQVLSSSDALLPVYDCSIFNAEIERKTEEATREDSIQSLVERMDLLEKFAGKGLSTMELTGISYGNVGEKFLWMARNRVRGVYFETEQFLEQNLVFSTNLISVLKKFKVPTIKTWIEDEKMLLKAKAKYFNVQVIAKLLDIDYPLQLTYNRLQEITAREQVKMTIKTKDILALIKRVRGFLDKDNRSVDLTLKREGVLEFKTGDFHSGGIFDEQLQVELDREENDIHFSVNFDDIELFVKSLKTTKQFTINVPLSDDKRILTSVGNPFKYDKEHTWSFFTATYETQYYEAQ